MKKRIVLCADDYGQAPAISQGIINLIEKNRLSAVSCMVNADYWAEHAPWLAPFQHQIDVGLHLNLTEGRALSKEYQRAYGEHFQPLGKVLSRAIVRAFSPSAIEAEFHSQIDRFQAALGFLPRYVDGHQHIHQFPVIRAALMNVYEQRLRGQQAYIRLVNERINSFKKMMVRVTGTAALKKLLEINNIPHNKSFAGIYSFTQAGHYPRLFMRFLQDIEDNGIIMCHPALHAVTPEDPISKARYEEYQYFISDRFISDCQAQKAEIGRFFRIL